VTDCCQEQHFLHSQEWAFRRSDYHLATRAIAALARRAHVDLDPRFSDHAPLSIDDDFDS